MFSGKQPGPPPRDPVPSPRFSGVRRPGPPSASWICSIWEAYPGVGKITSSPGSTTVNMAASSPSMAPHGHPDFGFGVVFDIFILLNVFGYGPAQGGHTGLQGVPAAGRIFPDETADRIHDMGRGGKRRHALAQGDASPDPGGDNGHFLGGRTRNAADPAAYFGLTCHSCTYERSGSTPGPVRRIMKRLTIASRCIFKRVVGISAGSQAPACEPAVMGRENLPIHRIF